MAAIYFRLKEEVICHLDYKRDIQCACWLKHSGNNELTDRVSPLLALLLNCRSITKDEDNEQVQISSIPSFLNITSSV